ncbi:MAG: ComEC/Rec2 family competence protein, partial [Candidatus Dormibacteraceae bacterium]
MNSLAAAAFIILIWDPQQLFGASFQLSFCCVLSIALLLPVLKMGCERLLRTDPLLPKELVPPWRQKIHGPLRWLFFSIATSLSAWLGSLPLTAYYFHLFSPVTLLANLLIVPLGSLALCANVGSLLCGAWWPWISELLNNSAWFCMECMIRFSQWAQVVPMAYLYVSSPSAVEMAVYYGGLLGLLSGWLVAPRRRVWAAAAAGVLALTWVVHWDIERHSPRLVILPMDGGLTVYVRNSAQDGDLVVDPGTTNAVELAIAPYLRAQGVNRLPTLLLSHGDVRHVGGSTLLAEWFANPHVYASPLRSRSPLYRRALGCFGQTPGKLTMVGRGDRVGVWMVLHPGVQEGFPQADDNAIVLAGVLNGTRVLLLSDLGPRGQNALLET